MITYCPNTNDFLVQYGYQTAIADTFYAASLLLAGMMQI